MDFNHEKFLKMFLKKKEGLMKKWFIYLGMIFFLCVFVVSAFSKEKVITDGSIVSMAYVLTVDGKVLMRASKIDPFRFVFREEKMVVGLESQLDGMKVGESKHIVVQPVWGFGKFDGANYREMKKTSFGKNTKIYHGKLVQFLEQDGITTKDGFVDVIKEDTVIVSFNHPLAGKVLIYDVEIVDIE